MRFGGCYLDIVFQTIDLSTNRLEHDVKAFRSEQLLQLLIMRLEYLEIALVQDWTMAKTD